MTFERFLHSGNYFIDEIKYLSKNRSNDKFFFSPDNMKVFSSRISGLSWKILTWEVEKYYFITSEKNNNYPRLYTVRSCDHKGNIEKISKFQEFETLYHARRFLYNFILSFKPYIYLSKCHFLIMDLKK